MKITPICIKISPFIRWHRFIEYNRNGNVVRRKVMLKEPEAHFSAGFKLHIEEEPLEIYGIYVDDKGNKWVCTSVSNIYGHNATLISLCQTLPEDTFYIPSSITFLGKSASETK
jgi:hypothetical protein